MMLNKKAILSVVDVYARACNARDADAFVGTFAPDAVSYDPVGDPPHVGRAALRKFAEGLFVPTMQIRFKVERVFVSGNSAAFAWTGRVTVPDGRSAIAEGIDVIEISDAGKIQKMQAYWDPAAMRALLQGTSS
ncbi:MAG: nuclear transport factor 2 family protein [Bryobacteraceae bacterium]